MELLAQEQKMLITEAESLEKTTPTPNKTTMDILEKEKTMHKRIDQQIVGYVGGRGEEENECPCPRLQELLVLYRENTIPEVSNKDGEKEEEEKKKKKIHKNNNNSQMII